MDFNDDSYEVNNIFDKELVDPYEIYEKILNNKYLDTFEINGMKGLTAKIRIESIDDLKNVVQYYSKRYYLEPLNWIDTSAITDMSYLFDCTYYKGDIS